MYKHILIFIYMSVLEQSLDPEIFVKVLCLSACPSISPPVSPSLSVRVIKEHFYGPPEWLKIAVCVCNRGQWPTSV